MALVSRAEGDQKAADVSADLEDTLKADLERLKAAEQASKARFSADLSAPREDDEGEGIKGLVDQFLIADFFFILAALAALAIAIGVNIATEDDTLAQYWLALWPFVFQPAIGILMAGALVSGGLGWIREQQDKMK